MNIHPTKIDSRKQRRARQAMRRADRLVMANRNGLTLLELLVVVSILVATAVIVLPMLNTQIETPGGQTKTVNEISTQTTFTVIRDAMVGEQGVMENLAHRPDALPREVSELVAADPPKHVKDNSPELVQFNPILGIGWRGPYLLPTGKNHEGKPTLVDGWGREIKLQVDFDADGQVDMQESKYIRLVSAGPNGEIETPADSLNMEPGSDDGRQLTMSECGDDLVLFLCVPDYRQ